MKFSQLSETLAPSEILKIGNRVKQALAGGESLYNYTIGDFDPKIFPIPGVLEEAIIGAYREHFTNYPLAEGNFDLRKSIREYISIFQDLHYDESEILVASGGRPLIFAL
ncbi:MAG: pyridoxal phosphate-dependent aminotransferase, partial [Bacteroidota bacterium]|nr:pyridoxal phosphate-dependent aminotransferase [Bacteroidota bacterium]